MRSANGISDTGLATAKNRGNETVPYVDEVFIGATDDVVVGDSNGVDAAPTGLQDMNTLQRADVPDLTHRDRKQFSGEKRKREREGMSLTRGE